MAELVVDEVVDLRAAPEVVWDFFFSDAGYALFVGAGPIPGLARVEWLSGGSQATGSVARAHNTDGSTHRERVLRADRPREYELALDDFSSLLRFVVSGAKEHVRFAPSALGTRIDRRFTFTLRTALVWPLALPLTTFFRRALRVNHDGLRAHFA